MISGTLSDSVANYDTIEVHGRNGTDVYDPGFVYVYETSSGGFHRDTGMSSQINFDGNSFICTGGARLSRIIGYR